MKFEQFRKLTLIIMFVIICVIAFILVMLQLVNVNSECVKNPFVYAANEIVDKKGEIIYSVCSCDVGENRFYFDRNGMYKNNPLLNP